MTQTLSAAAAGKAGLEILHHNASLVQFADQKAATLIVVNSIFIAASGLGAWPALSIAASALALVVCLAVVVARRPAPDAFGHDLVFFDEVLRHHSPRGWLASMRGQTEESFSEVVAASVYRTCGIARRKYACVQWALRLTMLSALLWTASAALRLA